jgi:hypothetical protein
MKFTRTHSALLVLLCLSGTIEGAKLPANVEENLKNIAPKVVQIWQNAQSKSLEKKFEALDQIRQSVNTVVQGAINISKPEERIAFYEYLSTLDDLVTLYIKIFEFYGSVPSTEFKRLGQPEYPNQDFDEMLSAAAYKKHAVTAQQPVIARSNIPALDWIDLLNAQMHTPGPYTTAEQLLQAVENILAAQPKLYQDPLVKFLEPTDILGSLATLATYRTHWENENNAPAEAIELVEKAIEKYIPRIQAQDISFGWGGGSAYRVFEAERDKKNDNVKPLLTKMREQVELLASEGDISPQDIQKTQNILKNLREQPVFSETVTAYAEWLENSIIAESKKARQRAAIKQALRNVSGSFTNLTEQLKK